MVLLLFKSQLPCTLVHHQAVGSSSMHLGCTAAEPSQTLTHTQASHAQHNTALTGLVRHPP